ncbi:pilin [Glycomyces sp. NPDC047369]
MVLILATPGAALADTDDIVAVLDNLRLWVVGIAGTVVAVMLTIAGLRYLLASEPGEAEKSKTALRAAAIGFAIILLAIPFVEILKGILTYE